MPKMPRQKPSLSRQDYQTPPDLLYAIKDRLRISQFDIDLAASAENAVCANYYDEQMDALSDKNSWKVTQGGWSFLNPPFAKMRPWVAKAYAESAKGANIAQLVPAAVGSNWWYTFVHDVAHVLFLNGRVTFVGETAPYPKDTVVLLWTPHTNGGYECWDWRKQGLKEYLDDGL